MDGLAKRKGHATVGAYVWRGTLAIVGNEDVPEPAKKLPLFRVAGGMDNSGRVLNWWLWDGEREWRIGELAPEQRNLPILEVVNHIMLVKLVAAGWAWADDV